MNPRLKHEYLRLRRKDWAAEQAWRAAKVNDAWADAEEDGLVRVRAEVDECLTLEDLAGDNATARELGELQARCEQDGVWFYITEYLDPVDGWTTADGCGGFVGDDWIDSGYDVDMKAAALDALEGIDVAMCEGWC